MTDDHPQNLTDIDRLRLDINALTCALLMKGIVTPEDLEAAMCELESVRELREHLEAKYDN